MKLTDARRRVTAASRAQLLFDRRNDGVERHLGGCGALERLLSGRAVVLDSGRNPEDF